MSWWYRGKSGLNAAISCSCEIYIISIAMTGNIVVMVSWWERPKRDELVALVTYTYKRGVDGLKHIDDSGLSVGKSWGL